MGLYHNHEYFIYPFYTKPGGHFTFLEEVLNKPFLFPRVFKVVLSVFELSLFPVNKLFSVRFLFYFIFLDVGPSISNHVLNHVKHRCLA